MGHQEVTVDRRDFRRDRFRVGRGFSTSVLEAPHTEMAPVPTADEVRIPTVGSARILAVHRFTGAPACIRPQGEAPVAGPSPIARALAWVREVSTVVADPHQVLEWVPDPRLYTTSAGRRVVHLHQHYRGIPVFEAMRTVIFGSQGSTGGALYEVIGDHVSMPDGLPLEPEIGAGDALMQAAEHLRPSIEGAGYSLSRYPARILAAPGLAAVPTLLHKLPFEDPVVAHLTFFDTGREARLAWFLSLRLSGTDGAWQIMVEASGPNAGRILWCRSVVTHARPGRGAVWRFDPGEPGTVRETLDFPASLSTLPNLRPRRPLPDGFPPPWIADKGTSGNNTRAKPFGGRILKGRRSDGVVQFTPDDPEGAEQRTLNAFYWCNHLHDLLFLLGFDEHEGNFQKRNLSGARRDGDPIEVRIVGRMLGDASFVPAEDGKPPFLSLGETAAGRHTALSADVVYHEVAHGLTNRLVGGHEVAHPMRQSFESEALDEGLCDWFALTIQNHARRGEDPPRPERWVFGAWAADDEERGLRPHSYEDYPLRFGQLATHHDLAEHHGAGQIWCATLLDMNRRLGEVLGDPRHGHELGWQLVVDALRETAKTTQSITHLNTRDRLFEALQALRDESPARADGEPLLPSDRGIEVDAAVRAAFETFGMGPDAEVPEL